MEWLHSIWLRMRTFGKRKRLDDDLSEEMAHHLAMRRQKFADAGLSDEEARAAASRRFGNVTLMKEETRTMWTFETVESFAADVRYAGRMLRKNPMLTVVIVLSLALGIGANTAIFSVLDSVLWQRLPVGEPQNLVLMKWEAKEWPERVMSDLEGSSRKNPKTGASWSWSTSKQVYQYVRDHNKSFESVFGFAANDNVANVGLGGAAFPADVDAVTGNFFQGLRITPVAGRVFVDSDDQPGATSVAMVSYGFWQKHMGGDASVVGKPISLNGVPVVVVGVTPPEFYGVEPGTPQDIWVTLNHDTQENKRVQSGQDNDDPKVWFLGVIGRLKPGVTQQAADAEVKVLADQVLQVGTPAVPRDAKAPIYGVQALDKGLDQLRYKFSTSLFLLMGMVGLVLLIACANVAGLLLAKATARQQEIAVRLSLGAPRMRLIRQLLTESVVLAVGGGLAGLLVARWTRQMLITLIQTGRNELQVPDHSNMVVLGFAFGVSVVCGIIFGLAPAIRMTRAEVMPTLKQASAKTTMSRSTFRTGKILVSAQVALCLLLLIAAGLMLKTLWRLKSVNLGFDRENLVTFRVNPGLNGYKHEQVSEYFDALQREIEAKPGVKSVAMSQLGPVGSGESSSQIYVPGYDPPEKPQDYHRHWVSAGYFETLGIPILQGRAIGLQDYGADKVGVINERFARERFKGDNPIGKQVFGGTKKKPVAITVIGVAGNAKYNAVRDDAPQTMYMPYRQSSYPLGFMTFLVRTSGDPRAVMREVQQAALKINKDVPVTMLKTETQIVDQVLFVERIFAILSTSFGALALLLACVGLYGTIAYTVAQRTNEIGIRMALGATPLRVVSMIVRETVIVVVAGLAVGLPLAWYATQVLKAQLFGLSPRDLATILVSIGAILLVTGLAGLVPAKRAANVDPMVALRYE